MSKAPPNEGVTGSDEDSGSVGEAGSDGDSGSVGEAGSDGGPGSSGRVSSTPAVVAVLALLAVPMTAVPSGTGDLTLVSLWGFVNTGSMDPNASYHLYPVWSYFGDQPRSFHVLPASIRAWPLAIGFHLLAAASATAGRGLGREDRRVTGGLLVLAALATLWVTVGVASRFGMDGATGLLAVLPASSIATLLVVAVVYRRDLVRIVR